MVRCETMDFLEEEPELLFVDERRHAMPQVTDPALLSAIEAIDDSADRLGYRSFVTIKNTWVHVALNDGARPTTNFESFSGVV